MAAITQNELVAAIYKKLQATKSTINLTDFTLVDNPALEATAAAFPNGRTEKFFDLDGSTMAYTFDGSSINMSNHIIHCWIRPDFAQNVAADPMVCSGYTIATARGVQFYLSKAQDDWSFDQYSTGSAGQLQSADTTFAVNNVIHLAVLCSNSGIDGGVKQALYINGVLAASNNTTIGAGVWSSTSAVGKNNAAAADWFDGGVFDFALLDYDELAASHTDAEIIAALYQNTLGTGYSHLFISEVATQSAANGLTINANKLRIYTNTAATPELAMSIDTNKTVTFEAMPKTPISWMRRSNGVTRGSTNASVIIYGTANESAGSDITYVNSATLGDSFLINTSGVYSISLVAWYNVVPQVKFIEIHVDTSINNDNSGVETMSASYVPATGYGGGISWVGYIQAGKRIWGYCSGANLAGAYLNQITICRVS